MPAGHGSGGSPAGTAGGLSAANDRIDKTPSDKTENDRGRNDKALNGKIRSCKTLRDQIRTDKALRDHARRDKTLNDKARTGKAPRGHTRSDKALSNHTSSDKTRSDHTRSDKINKAGSAHAPALILRVTPRPYLVRPCTKIPWYPPTEASVPFTSTMWPICSDPKAFASTPPSRRGSCSSGINI